MQWTDLKKLNPTELLINIFTAHNRLENYIAAIETKR